MVTALLNPPSNADMAIEAQLRTAVSRYLRTNTRYALAKNAGIEYKTLVRWYDERKDIRLSTAAQLGDFLKLELTDKSD